MERQVGTTPWFAAAGGLAAMAALALPASAIVTAAEEHAAAGSVDGLGFAPFGWAVVALLGVAVLDVIVACGLWAVFRAERPGASALAAAFRIAYAAVFIGAVAMLADARRIVEGSGGSVQVGELRDAAVIERLGGFETVWDAGLVLFGMHLAVIGWLLLRRSGAFAAIVGALVLLAGAGYVVDSVLGVLLPGTVAVAQFTFFGEVVLIAWLVVGGIRSTRAPKPETAPRRDPEGARR
ncbi:MAG: DUF4386 domain-containing protein [Agromyces sp.]